MLSALNVEEMDSGRDAVEGEGSVGECVGGEGAVVEGETGGVEGVLVWKKEAAADGGVGCGGAEG